MHGEKRNRANQGNAVAVLQSHHTESHKSTSLRLWFPGTHASAETRERLSGRSEQTSRNSSIGACVFTVKAAVLNRTSRACNLLAEFTRVHTFCLVPPRCAVLCFRQWVCISARRRCGQWRRSLLSSE